jgi:hypothetical protein
MAKVDDWFTTNDLVALKLKEQMEFLNSYAADLRAVADTDRQEILDSYAQIANDIFQTYDLQTTELQNATADIPTEFNDNDDTGTEESLAQNLTDEQKYTILIKDAVIRQIFVNSGMLNELKKIYGCDIYFGNKAGKYALIIKPHHTNYIINATNGFGGPVQEDRIFFNLSKKDITKEKIPTEYMCQYIVKDDMIHHVYKSFGKPTVLKHNEILRNKTGAVYNAYIAFNDLLKENNIDLANLISQLLPEEQTYIQDNHIDTNNITRFLSRDQILSIISKLCIELPKLANNEDLKKITETFRNKEEHDKILKKAMDTNNRVFKRGLIINKIEAVNRIPMIRKLFDTNNNFTETLAYRYARYYPDFKFTKSSIKKYNPRTNEYFKQEYSNPLKFKLQSTFTITDVYLHKFDRHINYGEYAMNRFNITNLNKITRLYKLMELAKSIMFTFISLSLQIKNIPTLDQFIQVNIYDIYPGLIWNTKKEIIISAVFKIYKKDNIIHIDIQKTKDVYNELNIITCLEVPFLGIEHPVYKGKIPVEKDYGVIRYLPIIDPKITIMLKKISPGGFEKYLIDDTLHLDNITSIYKQFFNVGNLNYEEFEYVNKADEDDQIDEYVEEPESFPELQHTSTVAPRDDEVIKQEELRRKEARHREEARRIEEARLKAEEAQQRRIEARLRDANAQRLSAEEEARLRQRKTVAIPAAAEKPHVLPPPGAGGVRMQIQAAKKARQQKIQENEIKIKKAASIVYNETTNPTQKKQEALKAAKNKILEIVPNPHEEYIDKTSKRIVDEIIKENASKMKYLKYKNKYMQLKNLLNHN